MPSANKAESLQQLQMSFAAHIRNPAAVPAPTDIEDRRMQIYRELFFNNINRLLASNFPVLKKIYGDQAWRQLVREFYTEHRAHTPLFPELPKEFLRYLQEQRVDRAGDPAFLLELAHYEWIELALALDILEIDEVEANTHGDLLTGIPLLSPLAWPLAYTFPVHRLSKEFQPAAAPAEATHLLAYRNRQDQVKFMEINSVTWLLLDKLQPAEHSGKNILLSIAEEIDHADSQAVVEHGKKLLEDLHQRDVVLGTRPDTA